MSLSKNSFSGKAGKVVLSAALLGALMLTACSPSNNADNSNTQSSGTATSEAPQNVTKFKSDAFDLAKQVPVDVKQSDTNIYLGSGVVSYDQDTSKVVFTPYEDPNKAWEYSQEEKLTSMKTNLMRWKDKTYIVVTGWSKKSSEASGLKAAKETTAQVAVVLDAETGKVANTVRSVESGVGEASDDTYFVETLDGPPNGTIPDTYIRKPFLTGLVTKNGNGFEQLLDPLTGKVIASYDQQRAADFVLNNEAGFYAYEFSDYVTTPAQPKAQATFGNYVLLATQQEEYKSKSGAYVQNSKYSLVDTVSKKTLSELSCKDLGNNTDISFSPNFRYVNFMGSFVYDTQTGKGFCTGPVDKEDFRLVRVQSLDNDGNMYAVDGNEYLRISLADQSKVETITKDYASNLPLLITDKGSAVFKSENSGNTLVAVPAKADTSD